MTQQGLLADEKYRLFADHIPGVLANDKLGLLADETPGCWRMISEKLGSFM
jgi:hypothetical protein